MTKKIIPGSYLSRGNSAMRAHDYQSAIALFHKALQETPGLRESIDFNLRLAKRKLENEKSESQNLNLHQKRSRVERAEDERSLPSYKKTPQNLASRDSRYLFCIEVVDCENHVLFIKGWIRDVLYPGLPVRITAKRKQITKAEFIARSIRQNDNEQKDEGPRLDFSRSFTLLESEMSGKISFYTDTGCFLFEIDLGKLSKERNPSPVLKPLRSAIATDLIEGNVEHCSRESVKGWAIVRDHPDTAIEVLVSINKKPFALIPCDQYRDDVKQIFGGSGFAGFQVDVPPTVSLHRKTTIEVLPVVGVNKIKKSCTEIGANCGITVVQGSCSLSTANLTGVAKYVSKVSIIILNKNGSRLLDAMFESAVKTIDQIKTEWIVVDHNSSDDSMSVCENYQAQGMDTKFIFRDKNYSFSDSCNYGAKLSSGEVLIFANNDLIFRNDVVGNIIRALSDPHVGLVGAKLLDYTRYYGNTEPAVQHLGVFINDSIKGRFIRPYESRMVDENSSDDHKIVGVPAVTGAILALHRSDFNKLEGFDTGYSYGLEDVDLCLRIKKDLGKEVLCLNNVDVIHHRGFSRKKDDHGAIQRKNNNEHFNKKWSQFLRRTVRKDFFTKKRYWLGRNTVIAFAVVKAGNKTSAGEYYTARELGNAIQKEHAIVVRYLPEECWYDLTGIDLLVTMVNRFDLNKVNKVSPFLITVNWTRQWFDRWAEDETLRSYDYVFASSKAAAEYLESKTRLNVSVLPIGSNTTVFGSGILNENYACDYVFTGSKCGTTREIERQLRPETIRGAGRVYGYNWEGTSLEQIWYGPLSYEELPDLYASTRIVIDDANVATKAWGSCNSRVFDALASGCLLITNGEKGAKELFGNLVPTFSDANSLTRELNYWLDHEDERKLRVKELQTIVRKSHSYASRASCFIDTIQGKPCKPRVSVKCAAKFSERSQWGDFHFANSLADSLRKVGFTVRVDCRESWNNALSATDDLVIVLRGLVQYQPNPHQLNIIWLISHPDQVTLDELSKYSHIFVASEYFAQELAKLKPLKIEFLPQCADINKFPFVPDLVNNRRNRVIFLGNSRGVFRESLKWALEAGIEVDVYGNGWEPFLEKERIKSGVIPNEVLYEIYASSLLVLNDHWEDMKRLGFVSNRIFDVVSCGGKVLTDHVLGIERFASEMIDVYESKSEFLEKLQNSHQSNTRKAEEASALVQKHHSFDARAERFKQVIESFGFSI